MEKSRVSLAWDKYHSNMCDGFSSLQQNGELVDLTLAADGQLVKVHQIVLGIASPYIKELIKSVDCKHPVIFLNNVSYTVLCNILEYVYTGEVSISEENVDSFMQTAKTLYIRGLEEVSSTAQPKYGQIIPVETSGNAPLRVVNSNTQKKAAELQLPATARNVHLHQKRKNSSTFPVFEAKKKIALPSSSANVSAREAADMSDKANISQEVGLEKHLEDDLDFCDMLESEMDNTQDNISSSDAPTFELQYTVSNRGSLQLILNRYVYNQFSRSSGGRVRRWRCVDYRDSRCPAAAVTDNNVVIKRTNLHNHPFHDKRILGKVQKKAVYSAIQAAENNSQEKNEHNKQDSS